MRLAIGIGLVGLAGVLSACATSGAEKRVCLSSKDFEGKTVQTGGFVEFAFGADRPFQIGRAHV